MKALLLARWLGWYRQLRSQAFELFVLGPIVLGGALLIADRYLMVGAPYLAGLLASEKGALRLGLLAAMIFAALAAAGVFRELYGERAGASLYDILPVSEGQRLVLAALASAVAALPASLLWTLGGYGLSYWMETPPLPLLEAWGLSFLAFWSLVLLDFLLVQLALRLGLLRAAAMAALAAALLGGLVFAPTSPLLLPLRLSGDVLAGVWSAGLSRTELSAPAVDPAAGLEPSQGEAAGSPRGEAPRSLGSPPSPGPPGEGGRGERVSSPLLLQVAICATFAAIFFLLFRKKDAGRAQALVAGSRALRLLPAAKSPAGALVRRDLLLVLRRFSPLVPLAFAASLGMLALLPLLVSRSGLEPLPLARTFSAGGLLAAAAWVALLPYLLANQLRTFWLESSVGATAIQLAKAKALTSLLLAAPAALAAAFLALRLLPSEGGLTAIAILCAAATLAISMGLTMWETPLEPAIALVYGLLIGGAIAALFVFAPAGWPFWLVAYVYLAVQLLGRVRQRIAVLEQPL
jgi:hypothetical protein